MTTTGTKMMTQYDMSPDVVAFSTTRHGGVSEGNYASFNINHYCGDDPAAIAENQRLLCERLGIERDHLIYPHQTHRTNILHVDKAFLSLSPSERQLALEDVDALVTDVPNVCVGVSTADCIPIIIYDPDHHAVATVHAGWRGTVARIAEKAVAAMRNTFASQPEKMCAVIGPGISLQNFEVGDEVYDIFMKQGFSMEKIAERFQKWHIDLPLCNSLQLQSCGIAEEKIQMSGICTYDSCHDYFSARRLGINSGRIFTGAVIRP